MALLLAGGARDPNLRALARRAHDTGIPVVAALTAPGQVPRICGDPERGELWLEGMAVRAGIGPGEQTVRPCTCSSRPLTKTPVAESGDVGVVSTPLPAPWPCSGARGDDDDGAQAAWSVTVAFLRGDVFGQGTPGSDRTPSGSGFPGTDGQAHADYPALHAGFLAVLRGWLARAPWVGQFNRDPFGRSRSVNKFAALHAAARAGLGVPNTRSGNDPEAFLDALDTGEMVQKPFRGGNYCCPLTKDHVRSHMADRSGLPVITAQPRLVSPELRVFRAGNRLLGYSVLSPELDYRTDRAARIEPCDVPDDLAGPLMALTDEMGLDWCASDFKRCPGTGRMLYLETNANPMFAAFDRAGGGELCDAILAALDRAMKPGPAVAAGQDFPNRMAPARSGWAASTACQSVQSGP